MLVGPPPAVAEPSTTHTAVVASHMGAVGTREPAGNILGAVLVLAVAAVGAVVAGC